MTLREFTETHLKPIDSWKTKTDPVWQKAFPSNIRWHEYEESSYYDSGWFFKRMVPYKVMHKDLEEEWVRIHNGEIIDKEWRKVYTY